MGGSHLLMLFYAVTLVVWCEHWAPGIVTLRCVATELRLRRGETSPKSVHWNVMQSARFSKQASPPCHSSNGCHIVSQHRLDENWCPLCWSSPTTYSSQHPGKLGNKCWGCVQTSAFKGSQHHDQKMGSTRFRDACRRVISMHKQPSCFRQGAFAVQTPRELSFVTSGKTLS